MTKLELNSGKIIYVSFYIPEELLDEINKFEDERDREMMIEMYKIGYNIGVHKGYKKGHDIAFDKIR